MLKKIIILLFILIANVNAEDFSQYSYVKTNVDVTGEVKLNYQSGDSSKLDYFESTLSFYPFEEPGQEVSSVEFISEPNAVIERNGRKIIYTWEGYDIERLNYGVRSEVVSKNIVGRVDKKLIYPNKNLRRDNIVYIQSGEYTDINEEIIKKANEIADDEDDLFVLVYNVAEWVRKNVKYDLNSVTEKPVKKSSWVLENKYGICDEITNLFISLLRSLGIPAKYISGLAYSDVVNGYMPHAWAEVYFPDYGWIPFDVTFGEYGWIDAGHIKMMEDNDANYPSVEYFWRAVRVAIEKKEFYTNTSIIEKGEKILPLVDMELRVLKDNVGEGSYVPIEINVKNLQPYYTSTTISVFVSPGIVGETNKAILLKPMQERKMYWLVNVSDNLLENTKYTGQIVFGDSFGASANAELIYSEEFNKVSYEDANKILEELKKEEEGIKTYDLYLDCEAERNYYFKDETVSAICDVKNSGNAPLNFTLCLEKNCKNLDLNIGEKKSSVLVHSLKNYYNSTLRIDVVSNDLPKIYDTIDFVIYDEPVFRIDGLNYTEVKYDEEGEVNIDVFAYPAIKKLEVDAGVLGKKYFENVLGRERLKISFKGSDLKEGENLIGLKFIYEVYGKEYRVEENLILNVKEISFLSKFLLEFNKLFNQINNFLRSNTKL